MTLREIDELIATKVMGWTLTNYETGEPDPEAWTEKKAMNNDGWSWEGQDSGDEAYKWAPTTDPTASKQLREKLAERFKTSALCRNVDQSMAFSVSKHGAATSYFAEAATEELAVALCALKSVGIEVEL